MVPKSHILPSNHILHQRYKVISALGQGGFGITYLAFDQQMQMQVCVKELFIAGSNTRGPNHTVLSQASSIFTFEDFMDRFLDEARQLARFNHPNIVHVLDVFQENETAYMVMEYVEGKSLKDIVLDNGPITEKDAMPLIEQLLEAVAVIHDQKMLHRDIKPENILIDKNGQLHLIDFGSAREYKDGKTTTQTAMLTPGYAPSEQYSNRAKRGPFTDVYALGGTFYFMLTGTKPIAVTDRFHEVLDSPNILNPELSMTVSKAIMKAMEIKPEDRFQTVEEFKSAIEQKKEPRPVARKKTTTPRLTQIAKTSTKKKNQTAMILRLVGILVLVGATALLYSYSDLVFGSANSSSYKSSEDRESDNSDEDNFEDRKISSDPEKKKIDYSSITGYYVFENSFQSSMLQCTHVRDGNFRVKLKTSTKRGCMGDLEGVGSMISEKMGGVQTNLCKLTIDFNSSSSISVKEAANCRAHGMNCSFQGVYRRIPDHVAKKIDAQKTAVNNEKNNPLGYLTYQLAGETGVNLALQDVIPVRIENTAQYTSYTNLAFEISYFDKRGNLVKKKTKVIQDILYPNQWKKVKLRVHSPLRAKTYNVRLSSALAK